MLNGETCEGVLEAMPSIVSKQLDWSSGLMLATGLKSLFNII
jgi:hypothetical protein